MNRRLLRMVASGLDRDALAEALGCDRSAVNERMRHIRRELEARNDIHAVVLALRQGLIE
ncbi:MULTISPECIES: LuxR C-terminal-related transcriptional regulator [unclassified Nocardioides]|uniref:LuxR C-terminal-related transcriptional regulator n=1 Tax=unclassified Nocardioides TaxID=2615069 RepID=UPI0012E3A2D9|nr:MULTISPECIES: LuxR C-terminal-related transcriptional regulator [unclassified Nocardioides]